jgi:hypothetical protein
MHAILDTMIKEHVTGTAIESVTTQMVFRYMEVTEPH